MFGQSRLSWKKKQDTACISSNYNVQDKSFKVEDYRNTLNSWLNINKKLVRVNFHHIFISTKKISSAVWLSIEADANISKLAK